jgi:hypothetical protein
MTPVRKQSMMDLKPSSTLNLKKRHTLVNLFNSAYQVAAAPTIDLKKTQVNHSRLSRIKGVRPEPGIDIKLLEKSAYKLNNLFSDKKAKKMDIMKHKIVDYDLFDIGKEKVEDLLFRDVKRTKSKNTVSMQMEEEAGRKNVYMDG